MVGWPAVSGFPAFVLDGAGRPALAGRPAVDPLPCPTVGAAPRPPPAPLCAYTSALIPPRTSAIEQIVAVMKANLRLIAVSLRLVDEAALDPVTYQGEYRRAFAGRRSRSAGHEMLRSQFCMSSFRIALHRQDHEPAFSPRVLQAVARDSAGTGRAIRMNYLSVSRHTS